MPTAKEMSISLEDARFFNDKIEEIVRGTQQGHDLDIIRRYFRVYLHCWKTVLHLIREAKGLGGKTKEAKWIAWCRRWQSKHLDPQAITLMDQLREMRDYDTHSGTLSVTGEVAAGLFPLVFVNPVRKSHDRRELVTCTGNGLKVISKIITTYASTA
jgi:hypothetical protein